MGLEQRAGRFYFYEKRRIGRRVISTYIGGGSAAFVAAELIAASIQERKKQRQELRKTHYEQKEIDRELARVEAAVAQILQAALRAAGFHQHKGQWRKKRRQG